MTTFRPLVLAAVLTAAQPGVCATADDASLLDAVTDGRFKLDLRYRAEHVDDDVNRDAFASTLRTVLGYTTAAYAGVSASVELEDVHVIGNDRLYNDGGTNGVTDRAVVVDPEGTELNQAWLRYARSGWQITGGRQLLTHRAAPFHRFVGNVGWRQNWQTYDGVRIQRNAERFSLDASYVYNVNRIFGEDNDLPNRSDYNLDAGLLRATFEVNDALSLEAYGYLLNFDDAHTLSTNTFGLRANGALPVADDTRAVYTLEYASQTDTGDNPNDLRLDYVLAEAGVVHRGWLVKLSHEWLEGDGQVGFSTPLATSHAFQGWADKFLATPAGGVRDVFLTIRGPVAGFDALLVAHDFQSTTGDVDFGRELDLQVTRKLLDRLTVGLKGALYLADGNSANVGGAANDTTKVWAWVQFSL